MHNHNDRKKLIQDIQALNEKLDLDFQAVIDSKASPESVEAYRKKLDEYRLMNKKCWDLTK